MITRIVKMTFDPNKVVDFLSFFEEVKQKIRGFENCHYLELLQAEGNPNIIFTYSKWTDEEALNTYRNSDLFKSTWIRTKQLFVDKPQAWTVNSLQIIDK